MKGIATIWKAPVYLHTADEGNSRTIVSDGGDPRLFDPAKPPSSEEDGRAGENDESEDDAA